MRMDKYLVNTILKFITIIIEILVLYIDIKGNNKNIDCFNYAQLP